MRKSGRLFIVIGVVLALIAGLLAVSAMKGGNKGATATNAEVKKVAVLQATHDIQANTVLRTDDIQVAQVEAASAPKNAPTAPNQVVGLATNGQLVKGQAILAQNLTTPGLTNLVSNGKRAIALPVDRVSALGGLIRADDYVDIVFASRVDLSRILPTNVAEEKEASSDYKLKDDTLSVPPVTQAPPRQYPYPGEAGSRFIVRDTVPGNEVSKIVLQNLHVLQVIAGDVAVAQQPGAPASTATSGSSSGTNSSGSAAGAGGQKLPGADLLVLEVDPQQAEIVKFLENAVSSKDATSYQVVLRSPDDHGNADTTGMTYDQLMQNYGLPAPKSVRLPGGGQ